MPPQLFRRIRALSPNDEDEGAFDGYKVIMEEIKREHPDLPPSVQQQMAIERFSSSGIKEKRSSQNQNHLLTALSNFRFGRGNKATGDPTTDSNNTNEPEDRRRHLNPRVSVARICTKGLSQSILDIPSDEDLDSLEDSLHNIEASAAPRRQVSRRVVRRESLKRASLTWSSTELLNVHEDEELLNASIPEFLANSKDRTQNSDQDVKSTKNNISITGDLPDEIKLALDALDGCDIDDGQRSFGSHDKSQGRRRSRVHESMRSSNASSFLSTDSDIFEGDFSAWGGKSSK